MFLESPSGYMLPFLLEREDDDMEVLLPYGEQLRAYDSPPLEFLVALALALVIVAVCLLISYVIRLSPFLGHYLFGVKY